MKWTEYLVDDRGIRAVYGDRVPSLDVVELRQVTLKIEGPTISLNLDLSQFPENPPVKWQGYRYNRLQVRLDFHGVRDVQLTGWTTASRANLSLQKDGEDIAVHVAGESLNLRFLSMYLTVQEMTPYQDAA
ncbi:MAG: hypothetical protein AMXMBFR59_34180 [Rhodanobacteraceae bacterium]